MACHDSDQLVFSLSDCLYALYSRPEGLVSCLQSMCIPAPALKPRTHTPLTVSSLP